MVATFSEIKIQDTLSDNAENLILSMPQIAQLVKNLPAKPETRFNSWVGKIRWRRGRLPTPVFFGFHGGSAGDKSARNAGDMGSIPGSRRYPGEGSSNPLQYSCLGNPMDRGAWWAAVHGIAKSQT